LSLDGANVSGSVIFNGTTFYGAGPGKDVDVSVDLTKTTVGNQLEIQNSYIHNDLKSNRLSVEGDALFRRTHFRGQSIFVGSKFSANFDLRGAKIKKGFDLSNVNVRNSLILHIPGSKIPPVKWLSEGASLSLQNAVVTSLQDWGRNNNRYIYDDLEGRLNITNFGYRKFGLVDPRLAWTKQGVNSPVLSGKERVERWLAMQRDYGERALPQPFYQLASTFEENGYLGEARAVRIAARDHALAAYETPFSDKFSLFLQKYIIGYGYETWRSLVWLAALVFIGSQMVLKTDVGSKMSLRERLWLSVDYAIPVIELDEKHKNIDLSEVRSYVFTHRILGFILFSFLAAGLSGLTK
jgi:hypothetical protein